MTALIQPTVITEMYRLRTDLISTLIQSITLFKQSRKIAQLMDGAITPHPDALIDTMEHVFYSLRSELGEYVKLMPKVVNAASLSDEKIEQMVTAIVDRKSWEQLFNRLNIFSLMTVDARNTLSETLKQGGVPFTQERIEATLHDIYANRKSIMINTLHEAVTGCAKGYASNSNRKFNSRTIFEEALYKCNGCYWRPHVQGKFRDVLRYLSHFVFGENTKLDGNAVSRDYLFELVSSAFTENDLVDLSDKTVYFEGGEIRFFQKGTAHLILNEQMIGFLNDQLSQSNTLAVFK